jgi:hypothetical protein
LQSSNQDQRQDQNLPQDMAANQGAAAVTGAAAAGAGAGGNPPIVGARNPGRQRQNRVLDFDQEKDAKFYKSGVEKLEGEPYDGSNLPTFLKTLGAKAKQYNWTEVLSVNVGNPPVRKSIIKQYGEITSVQVKQHALTYLGTGTRDDQNSDMIFNCLRKSITKEILDVVYTEPERYSFQVANEPEPLEDGPCFLKAVIDHTYTNTLANTAKARENLISLKEYMENLPDSNITEFNKHVKRQMETLAAGGETTTELVTNLFKGYAHCKDKDFRDWIKAKKRAYFDKTFIIHPNCMDFMKLVEDYYKDAVTAGEWMQPDDDQRTILALQTQVQELRAKSKFSQPKGKHTNRRQTKESGSDEWAWKKIPPKEGESRIKVYKGKTYYWCRNHLQWVLHKPSECRLKSDNKSSESKKKGKNSLKMRVYQAAMCDTSEEEDEEGETHQSSDDESVNSNTSN